MYETITFTIDKQEPYTPYMLVELFSNLDEDHYRYQVPET